jgi:glutamate 5-kinase
MSGHLKIWPKVLLSSYRKLRRKSLTAQAVNATLKGVRPVSRLVVKLGSSSIASGDGVALDVIAALVSQIAAVKRKGDEVVLVTSGAARLGRALLAFEGPTSGAAPALRELVNSLRKSIDTLTPIKGSRTHSPAQLETTYRKLVTAIEHQLARVDTGKSLTGTVEVALASSVGQPALLALYRQLAAAVGVEVCQILVSKADLQSSEAMKDLGTVLRGAMARGLLPVVNGNDTVDPRSELDNDQVAVAVAVAAAASRLLILTNVSGVFEGAPTEGSRLRMLSPKEARALQVSSAGEGRGGMRSKLNAAARAAHCGVETIIASASDVNVVARSLNSRMRVGTRIQADANLLEESQRWVGGIAYPMGTLYINREAENSLREGETLFLSGIKRVQGNFEQGAVVELVDVRHPERLIGRGSVSLSSNLLELFRALSPENVANVISILFRLGYELSKHDIKLKSHKTVRSQVTDARKYDDCQSLSNNPSGAANKAYQRLRTYSPDTVNRLTELLVVAKPRMAAAVLMDNHFRAGLVMPNSEGSRALRDLHAVHRDSLVVYESD